MLETERSYMQKLGTWKKQISYSNDEINERRLPKDTVFVQIMNKFKRKTLSIARW